MAENPQVPKKAEPKNWRFELILLIIVAGIVGLVVLLLVQPWNKGPAEKSVVVAADTTKAPPRPRFAHHTYLVPTEHNKFELVAGAAGSDVNDMLDGFEFKWSPEDSTVEYRVVTQAGNFPCKAEACSFPSDMEAPQWVSFIARNDLRIHFWFKPE